MGGSRVARVDFSGGARPANRMQTTITDGSSMTNFRSRTRTRNPRGPAFAKLNDSANVLPNYLHLAARTRITLNDQSAWTPAAQGECDSGEPCRTEPDEPHPAETARISGSSRFPAVTLGGRRWLKAFIGRYWGGRRS